jgi:hypothetical protein
MLRAGGGGPAQVAGWRAAKGTVSPEVIAARDAAYTEAEVAATPMSVPTSPRKQCCMCLRILAGQSPRTGEEIWRPARRVLPVSHGLCPACAVAYRAKAALKAG